MSVPLDTTLHRIADALGVRILPALDDGFAIETARLGRMLLTLSANAIDDAAALRVAENAAMRSLFAEAASLVDDDRLRTRLTEAAATTDPDLRISALDDGNDRLRRVLIALHAEIENQGVGHEAGVAHPLDQRIWRMLKAFETRRAPRL